MFSIVIPLFNEQRNIITLIDEINFSLKNFYNYEIIIIDDCSIDDTFKIVSKLTNKNLRLYKNNINRGQSFSIWRGIEKSSNEIIITIDGDGQNDPNDIPKLLECYINNQNIKLVGGIRKNRKDTFVKIISSKIANYIRSRILNDECNDTGCSLKVFNKNIFLSFPFFDGIHRFLPALFKGYGYETKFISVNHRKRHYGTSNYGTFKRLINGIKDMIKVKKILLNKKRV